MGRREYMGLLSSVGNQLLLCNKRLSKLIEPLIRAQDSEMMNMLITAMAYIQKSNELLLKMYEKIKGVSEQ